MSRGGTPGDAPAPVPARLEALAGGAVLALFAVRFHELLAGGAVAFRDAGYFFAPWREVFARQVSSGIFPLWNDAFSNGRAMAANPNAAVFWPLTWTVPAIGSTGLVLLSFALLLALFHVSLRWIGLSAPAAAAGGAVLLFSGVAQTLPVVFTTLASLAPLPIALAAIGTLDPGDRRSGRRGAAIAGAALGLSFLGGEPAIAAIGGLACAALALGLGVHASRAGAGTRPLLSRAGSLTLAALLALGTPRIGALVAGVGMGARGLLVAALVGGALSAAAVLGVLAAAWGAAPGAASAARTGDARPTLEEHAASRA